MNLSPKGLNGGFDRLNVIIGAGTALIAFLVYWSTVSRTISYWDCGEFLACAHILGNPHPPGSPVFVLVGRFFDILSLGGNVAFSINMLSPVSSAMAVLFGYLIVVRLVSAWYEGTAHAGQGRIIAYAAGFIGALFVAFGRTNWGNSVEAEVYSLSMFYMLAMIWLALVWFEHRYSPTGQRILILVAFLAALSVGLHLTTFLVVPFLAIFFCLRENATKRDWALVAGLAVFELLLIVMMNGDYGRYKAYLGLSFIMILGLLIYMRHKIYWATVIAFAGLLPVIVDFRSFIGGLVLCLAVTITVWLVKRDMIWRLAVLILMSGAIGWSVHLFIPIRSAQHPTIDENTPSRNFSVFADFLDRKQYGNISMTERMFVRRGSWENQFGDHARMGYWRFFKDQYSHAPIFPLFLLTGIIGLVMTAIKKPSWGYILIVILIMSSAGLVIYMNFADGTHYDPATGDAYQEVRDRDYFFTPAFVLFGLAIGLGMAALMEIVREQTARLGAQKSRLAVALSMLLVLTPLIPAQANYFSNDRSRNFMAYDYAYNLLASCEKDALLFTSGDNDTFPLWCIQEVFDFRKDVRVINFSLLNTDWYVWQLKNFQRVPMSLEDDQILWEPYTMPGGQEISKPKKPFSDRARNRTAWLVPIPYEGKVVRVSQMVLDDIVLTNQWKYPIYFSSAAGEMRSSPLKLVEHCYREGIALKLTKDNANLTHSMPQSDSLFFSVYQYRNYDDTLVAQNENETGIALTYPEKLLDYIDFLRRTDSTMADSALVKAARKIPSYWRLRLEERDMYMRKGDTLKANETERDMYTYMKGYRNMNPDNVFFYQYLGTTYLSTNDLANAGHYLEKAWDLNHDSEHSFRALLSLYAQRGTDTDRTKMLELAQEFKRYHNDDQVANEVIRSAAMMMQNPPPTGIPGARQPRPVPQGATSPPSSGK